VSLFYQLIISNNKYAKADIMKKSNKGIILAVSLIMLVVFLYATGMHRSQAQEPAGHDHSEHGHDELDASTLEEVANNPCEHAVPIYQCDECRYEVGLVKLAPELIKENPEDKGLIRTSEALLTKAESFLEATGEIQFNDNATVHITPRTAGIISAVHVDIGSKVNKGDVLFEMESVELGEAMAAYTKSCALTELSRKTYERKRTLFDEKVSSEAALIEAQMAYEENKAELEHRKQQLRVLGMTETEIKNLQSADNPGQAGRLQFRAPMDGMIIGRHAAVGNLIQPGEEVMLLTDLSTVWVWLDIYEQDLAAVLSNDKENRPQVLVETNAFPGRIFTSEIDYIGALMDEKTRTVKLRAHLDNPDGLLRPGMFCKARIQGNAEATVLAVDSDAVLSDEGAYFVFKHWKDDYYFRCPVKRGREFASSVEIREGLQAGETIITEGAFLLKSDILREKMGAGCAD
jgi:cobalt-zinc-cadmium efflux system membrane fusion protein